MFCFVLLSNTSYEDNLALGWLGDLRSDLRGQNYPTSPTSKSIPARKIHSWAPAKSFWRLTKLQFLTVIILEFDWQSSNCKQIDKLFVQKIFAHMWFLCFLFCLIWGLESSRLPDWVNFYSGELFLHKICFNRNISDKL